MKTAHVKIASVLILLCCSMFGQAQQTVATNSNVVVPTLVSFSGVLTNNNGKPLTSITGVTFSLYAEQNGGAPLWLETQNVQPDKNGNYSVMLGSSTSQGLPASLFASGQARWLEVQAQGQEPQARIMLLSVPYALKAGDAQTLNGQPASAFLAASSSNTASGNGVISNALSGSGTTDYVPLWLNSTKLGSSKIFQSTAGDIGIGTTSPLTALDVNGKLTVTATGITINASGGLIGLSGTGSTYGVAGNTSTGYGVYGAAGKGIGVGGSSSSGDGVYGDSVSGYGMYGASDSNVGVYGSTGSSTASGVYGYNSSSSGGAGVEGSGPSVGVYGTSTTGTGVAGASSSGGGVTGTSNSSYGVYAASNTGTAIYGASSSSDGVYGQTNGSSATAYGVYGLANAASGSTTGVFGQSNNSVAGVGVWGQNLTESSTAEGFYGYQAAGVWGDGGRTSGIGIVGTVDDGSGGYFANNSPSGATTLVVNSFNSAAAPFFAGAAGGGDAGYCEVDYSGNLSCSGTKNAVVPIDGGQRMVAISAIESPENWFEDFGTAQLVNGSAVVALDPEFIQTVNTQLAYRVFPVPNGDCKGVYVTNKTATSFEVRELGGGTSNVSFDYRITALRRNYENVRFADRTRDQDLLKRMQQRLAFRAGARPLNTENK